MSRGGYKKVSTKLFVFGGWMGGGCWMMGTAGSAMVLEYLSWYCIKDCVLGRGVLRDQQWSGAPAMLLNKDWTMGTSGSAMVLEDLSLL